MTETKPVETKSPAREFWLVRYVRENIWLVSETKVPWKDVGLGNERVHVREVLPETGPVETKRPAREWDVYFDNYGDPEIVPVGHKENNHLRMTPTRVREVLPEQSKPAEFDEDAAREEMSATLENLWPFSEYRANKTPGFSRGTLAVHMVSLMRFAHEQTKSQEVGISKFAKLLNRENALLKIIRGMRESLALMSDGEGTDGEVYMEISKHAMQSADSALKEIGVKL